MSKRTFQPSKEKEEISTDYGQNGMEEKFLLEELKEDINCVSCEQDTKNNVYINIFKALLLVSPFFYLFVKKLLEHSVFVS
jgi:hypothetical protein